MACRRRRSWPESTCSTRWGRPCTRTASRWSGISGTLLDAATARTAARCLPRPGQGGCRLRALAAAPGKRWSRWTMARSAPRWNSMPPARCTSLTKSGKGSSIGCTSNGVLQHGERVAEAYGFHPVSAGASRRDRPGVPGRILPLAGNAHGSDAWERLGRGGYVAALCVAARRGGVMNCSGRDNS